MARILGRIIAKAAVLAGVLVGGGALRDFLQRSFERRSAEGLREQFAGRITERERLAMMDGVLIPLSIVKVGGALISACIIIFIVIDFIQAYKVWSAIRKYSEEL